jgi:hypothetical protein
MDYRDTIPNNAFAMSTATVRSEAVLPFRLWWGLAGCAAFFGLILLAGPYDTGVNLAPDKGNWWYYWQRSDATVWSRLSAWLPYSVHQISIWYLIAKARDERPAYINGLHRHNVIALVINGFFMVLHVVQTRLFYDGLAQDTPEYTSFGSVALMLMMILVMENRRRGMIFGKPLPLMQTAGDTLRRYHGYFFAWAIIYTFWYHPVELTEGHLAGYLYMSFLILQSSLFFTRFHVNRKWTAFLEFTWAVHGAIVAGFIMNSGEVQFWSMFLFGGMAMFLITQLHGMGLSVRARLLVALPILAVMVAFYSQYPQYALGPTRQPMVLYLGAVIIALVVYLLTIASRAMAGPDPGRIPHPNTGSPKEPLP